jgi:hypothetical protein
MTNDDRNLHTCSLYCMRPDCILAQRNELRDRLAKQRPTLWALKDNPGITTHSRPQMEQLWDALGPIV